jgi:hypothetical protein
MDRNVRRTTLRLLLALEIDEEALEVFVDLDEVRHGALFFELQYAMIAAERTSDFLSPSTLPSASSVLGSLIRPSSQAAFSRTSGFSCSSFFTQQAPSVLHSAAASTRA